MSSNSNVILGLVGAAALTLVIGGGTLAMVGVGAYNNIIKQEKGITAVYRGSMLEYDKFWKTVSETAQVPDRYKDDFKDVLLSATEARYEGKDPMMNWIQEQNPALDATLYAQVQRVIETGRQDFTVSQTTLVDRQRKYDESLSVFPNSLFASWVGFPSELCSPGTCTEYQPQEDIDHDGLITVMDYRIVTSAKTKNTFATGEENEPVNVFGD
jgi:hypothetical protein